MPKFDSIFSSPGGASLLFDTVHKMFPGAERVKVPSLKDRNFANWWWAEVEQLPQQLKNEVIYKHCRDNIYRSLDNIDRADGASAWATAEREASTMAQNFTALANEAKSAPPSQWASFQNAAASVLLKVSAYIVVQQRDDDNCNLIEARLGVGKETRKLGELVPEPPDDIKIGKGVTAAVYLRTVTSPLTKNPLSQGYVDTILATLENRKTAPSELAVLGELARKVRNVTEALINQGKKGVSDDALAVRAILIAEAMTPEYSAPDGRPRAVVPVQVRAYDAAKVYNELAIGARDVQQRVKAEVAGEEREKKEIKI